MKLTFEKNERIIIPDENGVETLFEVLFHFDIEETNKSYLIASIVEEDEASTDEEVEVFAFRYESDDDKADDLRLFPIETDEEWEIVEEMFYTLTEEEE